MRTLLHLATIVVVGAMAGPHPVQAVTSAPVPVLVQQRGDTTTRVFPSIQGDNLEGRTLDMPRDFAGELNVVFVAFTRGQQEDVNSWGAALDSLRAQHPALRVYELPTLGRRYRIMRGVIDGGMRRGIPDPVVRAATITLYIDKDPFKRALGITSEDEIQVLLVDRQGRIRWQRAGRYTAKLAEELKAQLQR